MTIKVTATNVHADAVDSAIAGVITEATAESSRLVETFSPRVACRSMAYCPFAARDSETTSKVE